jgi:hypothetical protein
MTTGWENSRKIEGKIEFSDVFTSTGILIKITNLVIPEWRKIGYLKIEALIDGEFFNAQFRSIEFGNSLISIPYSAYRLSFEPVESLLVIHPNISIQIKEFNLNMFVSAGKFEPPKVGEPILRILYPPTGEDTSTAFYLAPERARRAALITNKTDKVLRIREGVFSPSDPLIDADPFTAIPPGGSYTVEDFGGEIMGLIPGGDIADGGRIIVKELPYIVANFGQPQAST